MKQKVYWNDVAHKKEFTTPFHFKEFAKYVRKDARILDVGCGYGRTLEQLYQNGYKNLIGIDFSEKMIQRGKKQYPYLDLRVKLQDNIELKSESCDAVILFAVLTCIINNQEQLKLLKDIERVLKPGGILYINDFLLNTDERNVSRYNIFVEKYQKYGVFELPEGAIVRHHHINWVEKCVNSFEKLSLNQVVYTTMNGNKSNGYYYLGRKGND
ncbi:MULTISPECIES: class I SAM-dependent methyltransferase [Clostridium]|uniref:class I SAM-dependent methyltransferase n=1 Tax=Clostridium TaxID=1485 RepID=UPI00066798D4|nr:MULTISPECIES: class I SAM-dependent methyltransferase [Clostridium]KRU46350.1 SAM-dependent methyltransferase [Clostridium sporogenes]MBY7064968.1 class I SAM-dependent methyltransferase [Clostridium sporogenes]MBY7071170.1 class I SAM-dependent methyltransferase [Clostridium sporogenes]MCW6064674.1 class I SAM-dependent methyltransferase [Clostridium sporogenes]MDU7253559.1 class I SAM-dependent methyltransferase [Clostridium sp.]